MLGCRHVGSQRGEASGKSQPWLPLQLGLRLLLHGIPLTTPDGPPSSGSLAAGRGAVYTSEPEVRVAENKRELEGAVGGRRGVGGECGPRGPWGAAARAGWGPLPPLHCRLRLSPAHFDPLRSRQAVLLLLRLLLSPRGVEVCPRRHHQPRVLSQQDHG